MSLLLKNISLALSGFTLEVDVETSSGVTAIFGPSGSGKTSLLDLIAGLRQASSAFIQLDERVLTDTAKRLSIPTHQRGVGYVPQDLALFPHLSVRQNLLYGSKTGTQASSLCNFNRVVEVLEIQPLIDRAVTALSGGEKQRIALARALLASPQLLLLDEPLASLDAPLKTKIIPYLARIRDEFRIPMLYVTHDRLEALALADSIIILIDGKALQTGPLLEVFNRPVHAQVAKLVGVETIQPGQVIDVKDGLAMVKIGNVKLTALTTSTLVREVFACIRGEDVILQQASGTASSVRNRLPSRIVALRDEGPLVRVELDAGFPLHAFITHPACRELSLKEGETVTALIKAPAIHLVPR